MLCLGTLHEGWQHVECMARRAFYLSLLWVKGMSNVRSRYAGHTLHRTFRGEHLRLCLFRGYLAESACFKACGGVDYVCVCLIVVSGIYEQLYEAARTLAEVVAVKRRH